MTAEGLHFNIEKPSLSKFVNVALHSASVLLQAAGYLGNRAWFLFNRLEKVHPGCCYQFEKLLRFSRYDAFWLYPFTTVQFSGEFFASRKKFLSVPVVIVSFIMRCLSTFLEEAKTIPDRIGFPRPRMM